MDLVWNIRRIEISILKNVCKNITAFDFTVARLLATISQFFKP